MDRFRLLIPDVGSMTVTQTSDFDDEMRREYRYVIRDNEGHLLTRACDLRSNPSTDAQSHPSAREMAGTLLSFLTCAPDSFNPRTAEWARHNDSELSCAALELEYQVGFNGA